MALGKAKLLVYEGLKKVGYFEYIAKSRWRESRLVILCYHGISLDDEHEWEPGLYMSKRLFSQRLALIKKKGYHVLPLGEGLSRLRAGTLPARAIVITFDDGFFDFKEIGWTLLKKHGFPATNYVPTYYSNHPWPVFNPMLSYLLWKRESRELIWPELQLSSASGTRIDHRSLAEKIRNYTQENGLSGEEKQHLLVELAQRLEIDFAGLTRKRILCQLDNEELTAMSMDGVDLQLHTHRHRVPADNKLFLKEIDDNRRALQRSVTHELNHFCYPSGEYLPQSGQLLHQSGVISATTCDHGIATATTNPLYLPRYLDSALVPESMFEAWISGAYEFIPHRKYRFGPHPD